MAEITPNVPPGASPLRPSDSGKVQPKKETVRINLPPKPTASPTIKLPTLPAASAASGASAAPAAAPKPGPAGPASAPKPPSPPSPGVGGSRVAGGSPSAPRPGAAAAPAAAQRSAPAPAPAATPQVSTLDKVLAISAAVVSLAALGCAVYLAFFLTNQPPA